MSRLKHVGSIRGGYRTTETQVDRDILKHREIVQAALNVALGARKKNIKLKTLFGEVGILAAERKKQIPNWHVFMDAVYSLGYRVDTQGAVVDLVSPIKEPKEQAAFRAAYKGLDDAIEVLVLSVGRIAADMLKTHRAPRSTDYLKVRRVEKIRNIVQEAVHAVERPFT